MRLRLCVEVFYIVGDSSGGNTIAKAVISLGGRSRMTSKFTTMFEEILRSKHPGATKIVITGYYVIRSTRITKV